MNKKIAIWFLCLLVLASVVLNIYLHKKYKELSTEKTPLSVAINSPSTFAPSTAVQETAETTSPSAGLENLSEDTIDDLEKQLAAIEQELDSVREKRADKLDKETEKKAKEKELQKMYMGSFFDSQFGDLFEELNLTPEKQDQFKEIYIDRNTEMAESASGSPMGREATQEEKTEIKKQTDKIKEKYEAKFKELLGDADYDKYFEYNERSSSRAQANSFDQQLATDDKLTKDQKKALIEIMYNEQEKAFNEMIRNQPEEPAPGMNEQTLESNLEGTENTHSSMMESAKDILSSSQLEAFSEYLKNQREMMKMSYSIQMEVNNSEQDD